MIGSGFFCFMLSNHYNLTPKKARISHSKPMVLLLLV